MRIVKHSLIGALGVWFFFCMGSASAASGDGHWEMTPIDADMHDTASLQRGAALFVNFCLGCHSLKYQRYERVAEDLGSIPAEIVEQNLIFTQQKIGDLMQSSMSEETAKAWFGAPPPDLTMVDRVRGTEWIYNFLRTFYADPSRPFGVNNMVFPNVGMPHVLLSLQGINDRVCDGKRALNILDGVPGDVSLREDNCFDVSLRPNSGLYSKEEFDQAAYDIANFLHYVGDPTRAEREAMGGWVIAFLVLLLIFAFFLNRNYWKDVY